MKLSLTRSLLLTFVELIAITKSGFASTVFTSGLGACPNVTPDQAPSFHIVPVAPPRIETLGAIRFAGINVSTAAHSTDFFQAVNDAWAELPGTIPSIPSKTNQSFSSDVSQGYFNFAPCFSLTGLDGFNFMPSVEVTSFDDLPSNVSGLELQPNQYAVFTYTGPPAGLADFRFSINEVYWPSVGIQPLDAPNFEVYAPDYDPSSPTATNEVWVAIPAVVPEPSSVMLALIGCFLTCLHLLRSRRSAPVALP